MFPIGMSSFFADPWVDQVGFFGGSWSPYTSAISSSFIGDGFFAFPANYSFFGGPMNPFSGPLAFATSLANSFAMPWFFADSPWSRYGSPGGYGSSGANAGAPTQPPAPSAPPAKAKPKGSADWETPAASEPAKPSDTSSAPAEPEKKAAPAPASKPRTTRTTPATPPAEPPKTTPAPPPSEGDKKPPMPPSPVAPPVVPTEPPTPAKEDSARKHMQSINAAWKNRVVISGDVGKPYTVKYKKDDSVAQARATSSASSLRAWLGADRVTGPTPF